MTVSHELDLQFGTVTLKAPLCEKLWREIIHSSLDEHLFGEIQHWIIEKHTFV